MGNEETKPNNKGSIPVYNKNIDKSKLDTLIKQVYFTTQINRDRRKGQFNHREKELLALIREPSSKRNKDNEYQKASAIVNDIKWLKAHECVMRYADIIKDNEMVIQMSKGDPRKVNDLLPYVESILWGGQKINLDCINAFGEFVIDAFGSDVHSELCKFAKVTSELKNCFDSILPSEKEVKQYLIELCKKNNIKLDVMNEIGHNLSEGGLDDMIPNTTNIKTLEQQTFQQNQGYNQPNFYPQGYPGNYGYPQQGGNFGGNLGGNFGGGYNQGNYGNFQQPNYGQGGNMGNPYGDGGNFGNFNQGNLGGGYQQGGFPQDGNQQRPTYDNTYNQGNYGTFQQGNFNQQGGYNQQGLYPQQKMPSDNTNLTVTIQGLPNAQNMQNQTTPADNKTTDVQQNNSAYPSFEKFTFDAKMGGKSNDPLDELDIRLKNIKEGL